jgi:hypothetical protein
VGERLEVAFEAFAARGAPPVKERLLGDSAEGDDGADVAVVE